MSDGLDQILSALTLEEKCLLVAGKNMWETLNVDRLGIQSVKTTDGPAGVRGATWIDGTHTTYIPCGISLAATFDPDLIVRIGGILGQETRSKRAHVLLAPTMNISRSPLGGRNFENFGEDPYLAGVMATSYITGVQQHGVGACMKHFVANDMETRRFNMDEKIDERTLREIYLRPFEMALAADPWTAMAAYPKINGYHADCNAALLRGILRQEWGYQGLVMSDWGGTNDTVGSIHAGTDLEMPGPPIRYGKALLDAIASGQVSEADHLDVSVRRLLRLVDRAGLLGSGGRGKEEEKEKAHSAQHKERDSDLPEFRQMAREAASSGIVLLKNEHHMLPLQPQSLKKLAIIGPNAKSPTTGGTGSASVNPYYITTPYDSISKTVREMASDVEISFAKGISTHLQPRLAGDLLKTPDGSRPGIRVDFYAGYDFQGPIVGTSFWNNSVIFMMNDGDIPENLRGKPHCYRALGVLTPVVAGTYDVSLSNTGKTRLFLDDELLIDNSEWTTPGGTFMNCGSVNKVVSLDLESGRSYSFRVDNLVTVPPLPPHDNTLFYTLSGVRVGLEVRIDMAALFSEAVATAKDADAVVLVVGHNNDTEKEGVDRTSLKLPRDTDRLVEAVCRANAKTVVVTQSASAISMPWAGAASAIVHAWYQGQENGNAVADVLFGRVNPSGKLPVTFPVRLEDHGSHPWFPGDVERDVAEYGEGVLVGYRWFDEQNKQPQWPFGFGLSYTTFQTDDIRVSGQVAADGSERAVVTAMVANIGDYDGAEVLQVYTSPSPLIGKRGLRAAPKSLAGFAKVFVNKGDRQEVAVPVDAEAFRWFDVEDQAGWRVDKGVYKCYLGTSSRDIRAEVEITVN